MADNADTAVRAVSTAITTPVKKVTGLAAAASPTASRPSASRRDVGEAVTVAKDAAARRESELDEELRGAGTTPPDDHAARRVVAAGARSYPLVEFRDADDRRAARGLPRLLRGEGPPARARPPRSIPRADDHSTLLTTAGMQPQMPYFLGREDPPAPLTTTAQKCFRTPDIDEVGLDSVPPHVLRDARQLLVRAVLQGRAPIELATEFIRERMQLDWDRIWASVHAGDPQLGLGPDEVTIELWKEIGHARRADRAAADVRELLVGRRAGAVRPGLGALLRLGRRSTAAASPTARPAARAASASSSSGTSCSWSSSSTRTAR